MTFRSFGRVALASAFTLGLATLPTSCGGGHSIDYMYVLGTSPCAIYAFGINSNNGAIAPASTAITSCPSGTSNPVGAVVSPDYKYLYVLYGPDGQAGTIQSYSVNHNSGSITPLSTYTTAGEKSATLAIDPGGKYLYAVDTYAAGAGSGPGVLSFYSISGSGALAAPTCSGGTVVNTACSYPVGYAPVGAAQLFNGTYVYVTNSGSSSVPCSGTVSGYAVAAAGLTPIAFAVPKGACPNGATTPVPANSLPMGVQPQGITTDPSSSFVFITDYQQSELYSSQVNSSTGNLFAGTTGGVTGQGYPVGKLPQNVIVEPRGQYVYVSNSGGNTISAFVLAKSTGALSAVSGGTYNTGAQPLCLAVEPLQGDFLYVVNYLSGNINGFSLTGNTGQLGAAGVPNQPFAVAGSSSSAPVCLAISATGPTPIPGTP